MRSQLFHTLNSPTFWKRPRQRVKRAPHLLGGEGGIFHRTPAGGRRGTPSRASTKIIFKWQFSCNRGAGGYPTSSSVWQVSYCISSLFLKVLFPLWQGLRRGEVNVRSSPSRQKPKHTCFLVYSLSHVSLLPAFKRWQTIPRWSTSRTAGETGATKQRRRQLPLIHRHRWGH
jgi:hypothetical protein